MADLTLYGSQGSRSPLVNWAAYELVRTLKWDVFRIAELRMLTILIPVFDFPGSRNFYG